MGFFFTADEHYGHDKIRGYSKRPFDTVEEMNETIISRHNQKVKHGDVVVHVGDFTLNKDHIQYLRQLNGHHIFLKGSHDYWMVKINRNYHEIWEKKIDGIYVVACHYAMRTWARSHFNSYQLFAHSHNRLEGIGKQMDVGVDCNNFYPFSFEEIKEIMKDKPDNPNLIREDK